MVDFNKAGKFGLRAGLSVAIVATRAARYGAHFSFGVTKGLLNGVSSLAGSFSGSAVKFGVGDFLIKEVEKGVDGGFNKLIGFEKYLREKAR